MVVANVYLVHVHSLATSHDPLYKQNTRTILVLTRVDIVIK